MRRVLMIEDEDGIRAFAAPYLRMAGFSVDEAADGKTGLAMALVGGYDIVLLDIMLPELSGMGVCAGLREHSTVPVLMLTARGEEEDIVAGFESGADDYLVKPFSPKELVARVKALIQRCSAPIFEEPISIGPLSVNPAAQSVELDGKPLALTPKEFDTLLLLAKSVGRVYSRDELLRFVWGYEFIGDTTRTVDTHVKQLREKLGDHRGMIVTVWGKGYKISEEE